LVKEAFSGGNIRVFNDSAEMFSYIKKQLFAWPVYLFMSSGDFDGCDLVSLSEELLSNN